MGCKCANANEEEEEIKHNNRLRDGKEENEENENKSLLGFDNQEKQYNKEGNQNNEENENIDQYVGNNINNYDVNAKYADYPKEIVKIINNIRKDPVGYADMVEDSIKYIIEEEDKNDPTNKRLIFKKKVKVALNKGEPAFREAIEILRLLEPLPPLAFSNDKCIPLPKSEEELKDPTFLREQVRQIREGTQIDVYFKDLIKDPEVSGLLMIVDDTNKNAGKKRMTLLNKELKYVGVNSKFIGKTFVAYFAFSK
jgi:hypothetical protein